MRKRHNSVTIDTQYPVKSLGAAARAEFVTLAFVPCAPRLPASASESTATKVHVRRVPTLTLQRIRSTFFSRTSSELYLLLLNPTRCGMRYPLPAIRRPLDALE